MQKRAMLSVIVVALSGPCANPPPCLGNAAPGRGGPLQNNIVRDDRDKGVLCAKEVVACTPPSPPPRC